MFTNNISPKNRIRYLFSQYDDAIRYTDKFIGMLINKLRELDLLKKTLIIFTSDHGEEFFEHKKYDDPFNGHMRFLYDTLIKVPLIFHLPDKIKQNQVINEQVMSIDIYPTILDILQIIKPGHLQGNSLLPFLKGDISKLKNKRPLAFSEEFFQRERISVRTENHKFILRKPMTNKAKEPTHYQGWSFSDSFNHPQKLLFDLKKDSAEQNNIIADNKTIETQMLKEIDLFQQGNIINYKKFHSKNTSELELDEGTKKRLRALGYIN